MVTTPPSTAKAPDFRGFRRSRGRHLAASSTRSGDRRQRPKIALKVPIGFQFARAGRPNLFAIFPVWRSAHTAQAAKPLFIEGGVWTRNPLPNPQLHPRRSLLRSSNAAAPKLAATAA
jgi:hypothetical protein